MCERHWSVTRAVNLQGSVRGVSCGYAVACLPLTRSLSKRVKHFGRQSISSCPGPFVLAMRTTSVSVGGVSSPSTCVSSRATRLHCAYWSRGVAVLGRSAHRLDDRQSPPTCPCGLEATVKPVPTSCRIAVSDSSAESRPSSRRRRTRISVRAQHPTRRRGQLMYTEAVRSPV